METWYRLAVHYNSKFTLTSKIAWNKVVIKRVDSIFIAKNVENVSQLMIFWYLSHLQSERTLMSLHKCSLSSEPCCTRQCSAVSRVSDYTYMSDCRYRGRELDRGLFPYFVG